MTKRHRRREPLNADAIATLALAFGAAAAAAQVDPESVELSANVRALLDQWCLAADRCAEPLMAMTAAYNALTAALASASPAEAAVVGREIADHLHHLDAVYPAPGA